MDNHNFQFTFSTSKTSTEVFAHLINPNNWWIGLYGEILEGKSEEINDEFTFKAGDGIHYSKQKLVEIKKDRKIEWIVIDSNLSFLTNTNEWNGTSISFEIDHENENTKVTFLHKGLVPEIECYEGCSKAWTLYLQNIETQLKQLIKM